MRWTERQQAMLREMGVPSFWPVEATAAVVVPAAVVDAPAVGARPVSRPAIAKAPALTTPPASALASADVSEFKLGTRPVGIETMAWPALQEAVMGCQACSLCNSRKQTVFGAGNAQARWMIVGEAPGEQEDRDGEPFVGRAGQLLDRMLTAVGLTRAEAPSEQQVYIANVLKCRPPANRNPLPQEVAQCEPYLLRQMALVQPDLILAMGRFAVQSLLKTSEPIGKLRGRIHEVQGIPVVVTYHPAYLLRNPADKALAWDDLCLARELQERRTA
jgi:uracil-DNA glycosylase family 4